MALGASSVSTQEANVGFPLAPVASIWNLTFSAEQDESGIRESACPCRGKMPGAVRVDRGVMNTLSSASLRAPDRGTITRSLRSRFDQLSKRDDDVQDFQDPSAQVRETGRALLLLSTADVGG